MNKKARAESAEPGTIERDAFRKDPASALQCVEKRGSVVITEHDGRVHAILSVPSDDRPIVD
jgi:hypothetical protein